MAFNVNEIRSQLTLGGARASLRHSLTALLLVGGLLCIFAHLSFKFDKSFEFRRYL